MFVGHSLLAFALAGLLAFAVGASRERALAVAGAAALFAATPDVDIVLAVAGLANADPVNGFWSASTETHRGVTHSLVVAVPAAAAAACWCRPDHRWLGAGLLAGVVALVAVTVDPVETVVAALFGAALLGVATAARRLGLGARATLGAALVGLCSHPFGDLFTGGPPALFAPLTASPFDARVAPFADPTLDFLLAFGVELAAIWAGVLVFLWLRGIEFRRHVRVHALLGAAYAGTCFVLPRPTLEVSYLFVFSILPVGAVGVAHRGRSFDRDWLLPAAITGLTAVTVAGVAYAAAYVVAVG